jgi:hypothetical protein
LNFGEGSAASRQMPRATFAMQENSRSRNREAVPRLTARVQAFILTVASMTPPRISRRDDPGHDQFSRMDRRRLGDPVLAPQGLHPGLHDRARLHGGAEAGIRQAQHQDHRPQRRPGERATVNGQKDIEETQGHAVTYPMIGDPELKVAKLYDMLPAESGRHLAGPHRGDQRHRALGLR